jgi:hypothetical protein
VEAWQHVKPSRTNRPSGLTGSSPPDTPRCHLHDCSRQTATDSQAHFSRDLDVDTSAGNSGGGTTPATVGPPSAAQIGCRSRRARTATEAYRKIRRREPTTAQRPPSPISATECVGGFSVGVTPVPIPNTAVKPHSADGTAGVARWESTSPPAHLPKAPVVTRRRGPSFLHMEQRSKAGKCSFSDAARLASLPLGACSSHFAQSPCPPTGKSRERGVGPWTKLFRAGTCAPLRRRAVGS